MSAKDARLGVKTTKTAKAILEQAANALGTTLSAFMLDSAMTRAREVLAQSQVILLNQEEVEQFSAALGNPPEAMQELIELFKKHGSKS